MSQYLFRCWLILTQYIISIVSDKGKWLIMITEIIIWMTLLLYIDS